MRVEVLPNEVDVVERALAHGLVAAAREGQAVDHGAARLAQARVGGVVEALLDDDRAVRRRDRRHRALELRDGDVAGLLAGLLLGLLPFLRPLRDVERPRGLDGRPAVDEEAPVLAGGRAGDLRHALEGVGGVAPLLDGEVDRHAQQRAVGDGQLELRRAGGRQLAGSPQRGDLDADALVESDGLRGLVLLGEEGGGEKQGECGGGEECDAGVGFGHGGLQCDGGCGWNDF